MDDGLVRVGQGSGDAADDEARQGDGQQQVAFMVLVLESTEVRALDIVHDHEVELLVRRGARGDSDFGPSVGELQTGDLGRPDRMPLRILKGQAVEFLEEFRRQLAVGDRLQAVSDSLPVRPCPFDSPRPNSTGTFRQ